MSIFSLFGCRRACSPETAPVWGLLPFRWRATSCVVLRAYRWLPHPHVGQPAPVPCLQSREYLNPCLKFLVRAKYFLSFVGKLYLDSSPLVDE